VSQAAEKGPTSLVKALVTRDAEMALRFISGLGCNELARLYGINPTTVCRALRRAGVGDEYRRSLNHQFRDKEVKAVQVEPGSRFYNVPEHLVIINPYVTGAPVTHRDEFDHLGD